MLCEVSVCTRVSTMFVVHTRCTRANNKDVFARVGNNREEGLGTRSKEECEGCNAMRKLKGPVLRRSNHKVDTLAIVQESPQTSTRNELQSVKRILDNEKRI